MKKNQQQQQQKVQKKKKSATSSSSASDNDNSSSTRKSSNNNKKFTDRFYDQDELAIPDKLPEGMSQDDLLNELSLVTKLFTALYLGAIVWGLSLAYRGEIKFS